MVEWKIRIGQKWLKFIKKLEKADRDIVMETLRIKIIDIVKIGHRRNVYN